MASPEVVDRRLDRFEEHIRDIKQDGREMRADVAKMHTELLAEIRELKGAVSRIPTTLQFITLVLSTWAAGAAIVLLAVRIIAP